MVGFSKWVKEKKIKNDMLTTHIINNVLLIRSKLKCINCTEN